MLEFMTHLSRASRKHDAVWVLMDQLYKTRENSIFLKKSKTVISVKFLNFSRYWMMKRTPLLKSSREI